MYSKNEMFINDKNSPFVNTDKEKDRCRKFLQDNGYIVYNEKSCLVSITEKGYQYVDDRCRTEAMSRCQYYMLITSVLSAVAAFIAAFKN